MNDGVNDGVSDGMTVDEERTGTPLSELTTMRVGGVPSG